MKTRFKFRAFFNNNFIYKDLLDTGCYDKNGKYLFDSNNLSGNLQWEQSLGILDRNGQIIFENDIYEYNDQKHKIVYDESKFAFLDIILNTNSSKYLYELNINLNDITIISNTHRLF